MVSKTQKVGIIGAGKVGRVLGRLLRNAGYKICVSSRSYSSVSMAIDFIGGGEALKNPVDVVKRTDIIFITTPDDVIEKVCNYLREKDVFDREKVILHCSGVYSSEILKAAKQEGAYIGSLHPLRSFGEPENSFKQFIGTLCVYEGDKEILPLLKKLIEDIGGRGVRIKKEDKVLYHISAVFCSNYVAVLKEIGLRLFNTCGIKGRDADVSLQALMEGTMNNIKKVGLPEALTGPIERGDLGTVRRHLECLNKRRIEKSHQEEEILEIYLLLGKIAVEMAVEKGSISSKTAQKMKREFRNFL